MDELLLLFGVFVWRFCLGFLLMITPLLNCSILDKTFCFCSFFFWSLSLSLLLVGAQRQVTTFHGVERGRHHVPQAVTRQSQASHQMAWPASLPTPAQSLPTMIRIRRELPLASSTPPNNSMQAAEQGSLPTGASCPSSLAAVNL